MSWGKALGVLAGATVTGVFAYFVGKRKVYKGKVEDAKKKYELTIHKLGYLERYMVETLFKGADPLQKHLVVGDPESLSYVCGIAESLQKGVIQCEFDLEDVQHLLELSEREAEKLLKEDFARTTDDAGKVIRTFYKNFSKLDAASVVFNVKLDTNNNNYSKAAG